MRQVSLWDNKVKLNWTELSLRGFVRIRQTTNTLYEWLNFLCSYRRWFRLLVNFSFAKQVVRCLQDTDLTKSDWLLMTFSIQVLLTWEPCTDPWPSSAPDSREELREKRDHICSPPKVSWESLSPFGFLAFNIQMDVKDKAQYQVWRKKQKNARYRLCVVSSY